MAPDHPLTKLHRSEILALCQSCPGLNKMNCIIADIEGSREEYLTVPECLRTNEGVRNNFLRTNEKTLRTNEELRTQTDNKKGCATDCAPPDEERCAHMVETGKIRGISVDSFDFQICRLAANKHHIRSIARILRRPESTVRYRIRKLQQQDLITSYNGAYGTKLYHISSTLTDLFIHNEDLPTLAPFTAHSMSFKFPILEGTQPRGPKGYKTNTWTGYVFRFPDYTIRSTPSNIIIDINQDLGAGSINDLNLKYSQLAQSYAYSFAEKQHIILGGVSRYRDGHFTIEDSALAQLIAERGQICTTSGLFIDKSRSTGDLEMKEETARSMEFTINKLPVIAAGLQSDLSKVTAKVDSRISGMENSLDSIQQLLVLERENQELRKQNRILEKSLSNITATNPEKDTGLDTDNKKNEGGMYG